MKRSPTFVLVALALVVSSCAPSPENNDVKVVFIQEKPLRMEVAATPDAQERGLAGRPDLTGSDGMLFMFPDDEIRYFWMKGMQFSLDIAFLDNRGVVLNVARSLPPCAADPCLTVESVGASRFVLEVKAGGFNRLKEGEHVGGLD